MLSSTDRMANDCVQKSAFPIGADKQPGVIQFQEPIKFCWNFQRDNSKPLTGIDKHVHFHVLKDRDKTRM